MDSQNQKRTVSGSAPEKDEGIVTVVGQNLLAKDGRKRLRLQLTYPFIQNKENEKQQFVSDTEEEYVEAAPRLLVAEDNVLSSKYISILLEQKGIAFDLVDDGKRVVEQTQQKKYDLILMDVHMPGLNGYEATNQIRQSSNPNRETPIVALTASDPTMHKEKAVNSGMNDFLLKPYKRESLYSLLEQYLPGTSKSSDSSNDKNAFHFSTELDAKTLEWLYQDDLEYAEEMFGLFFKISVSEYHTLQPLLQKEEWEKFRFNAHKLKPAFKMVGLPVLWEKMKFLEELAERKTKGETTEKELIKLLGELDHELTQKIPVVEKELQRIQEYLNL